MCNFIKIRPMGTEMYYADSERTDGWTDRHDEANNRFLKICESA
jgi:hypothetical protein